MDELYLHERIHLDDDDILSAADLRPPAGGDLGAALVGGHHEGVLVHAGPRLNIPGLYHGREGLSTFTSSAERKMPGKLLAKTIYLIYRTTNCP